MRRHTNKHTVAILYFLGTETALAALAIHCIEKVKWFVRNGNAKSEIKVRTHFIFYNHHLSPGLKAIAQSVCLDVDLSECISFFYFVSNDFLNVSSSSSNAIDETWNRASSFRLYHCGQCDTLVSIRIWLFKCLLFCSQIWNSHKFLLFFILPINVNADVIGLASVWMHVSWDTVDWRHLVDKTTIFSPG